MAVSGVHQGTRRLLVLTDGARWIREWFEGLAVPGRTLIVCWWHLVKRVEQDLSRACRGWEHRRTVEAAVLKALWQGQIEDALQVLQSRPGAAVPAGRDEEWRGFGGVDRLPGGASSLPARL